MAKMNDELDRMNNWAKEILYVVGQCKNSSLVCQFMHAEISWLNSFQKMSPGNEYKKRFCLNFCSEFIDYCLTSIVYYLLVKKLLFL